MLALFRLAAISEFSPLSGVKRKWYLQPAKSGFWRKAVAREMAIMERPLLADLLKNPKIGQRKKSRKSRSRASLLLHRLSALLRGPVIDFRRNDMIPHVVAR